MYKHIAANKRNTVIILIAFIAIIATIGAAFAYYFQDFYILVYFSTIATIYAIIQYFAASRLAVAMTGAKKIEKKDDPRLYNVVENLSISTGLPMPEIYIIEDSAPNAFASGRDPSHSLVAATTGLLDIMNNNELTAVMAHEMSHIRNYDIRITTIVFGLVSVVGFISDIGLRMLTYGRHDRDEDRSPVGAIILLITSILAPLAAMIAQFAVSREREYLADASAVNITRYPDGMISALKKLDTHSRPMRSQNVATEALFINNPLKKGTLSNMFSTHPPIEKRIERLENGKKSF